MKTGAIISNGTDVPVENIDPIASFYAAVSLMMNTGKSLVVGGKVKYRRGGDVTP